VFFCFGNRWPKAQSFPGRGASKCAESAILSQSSPAPEKVLVSSSEHHHHPVTGNGSSFLHFDPSSQFF